MGKRIIQQARGKGSSTYRVKKKAFNKRVQYSRHAKGEFKVVSIVGSAAHSCPLAKVANKQGSFYIPAFKGMYENSLKQVEVLLKL
jgi:ribosomal protein L2